MTFKYLHKLPIDMLRYILPYTYNVQSKELLRDIRSYIEEYALIDSVYSTQYNYNILLCDLEIYLKMLDVENNYNYDNIDGFRDIIHNVINNRIETNDILSHQYYNRYNKHLYLQRKDTNEIVESVNNIFLNKNKNAYRKTKLLFGLLTPEERTRFFNTYILL